MNILFNPYETHPEVRAKQTKLLQTRIPRSLGQRIYSISPEKGSLQSILNHLLKKLENELDARNIAGVFNQDSFFDLIVRSKLVLPEDSLSGSTASSTLSEAKGRNDARRNARRNRTSKKNA
mgnify:CR=1 FL=1